MNDTEKAARLEELRKLNNDTRVQALIVDMVELECQLDDLRQLPKYRVNPNNSAEVKISPAFYAYQKSLSAYKEIVKVLIKSTQGDDEEISPLREYLKTIEGKKGVGV
jgi:hypothetical protein